jgi:hypothetical protein
VTLNLRESFPIKSYGQDTVYAPFADMPEDVLVTLIEQGALRILNDGAGGKDKTDVEKAAGMRKRIDAWIAGNFHITTRGSTVETLMREALRNRLARALGVDNVTDTQFRGFMVDSIVKAGGKKPEDGKAIPIEDVIAARAKLQAPDDAEFADKLASELEAEGTALANERAKAVAKLDVTGIVI